MIATYHPNFTNPIVKRRLLKIEDRAISYYKNLSEIELHHDEIAEIFGARKNKLSGYLVGKLLTRHGQYIPGERSFHYTFSWTEFLRLNHRSCLISDKDLLEFHIPLSILSSSRITSTHDKEIKHLFELRWARRNLKELLTRNARYKVCKSTKRLTSPWQNLSKHVRKIFFNGWWDYDIKSAAYTLVWQKFINEVLPWWGTSRTKYEVLPRISENPDEMRQLLANELNVSVPVMKQLLAALLFGTNWVFNNPEAGAFKIIKNNTNLNPYDIHELALKSELIIKLKAEIKDMWKKHITYWNNQNNKVGKYIFRTKKKSPLSTTRSRPSSHRANIYFEIEKQVRDVIIDHIKHELEIKLLHVIHDGFLLKDKLVDIAKLLQVIQDKLGYKIKLSEEQLVSNITPSIGSNKKNQEPGQETSCSSIMVLPFIDYNNEINHLWFQELYSTNLSKTPKTIRSSKNQAQKIHGR